MLYTQREIVLEAIRLRNKIVYRKGVWQSCSPPCASWLIVSCVEEGHLATRYRLSRCVGLHSAVIRRRLSRHELLCPSISGSARQGCCQLDKLRYHHCNAQGRPQGGGGSFPPPRPKPKKLVVEKWCYFPELYKITKVREDGIEKG